LDNPLISIIVPIYNVEQYLQKCIVSIVSQTYSNLEIIMVDDESPDSCPRICDDWAKRENRIKVIHKKNEGLGLARNSGLDLASGDYVVFVDSDDYLHEDMVMILYESLKRMKSDTVFCGLNRVDENGRIQSIPSFYDNMTFKNDEIIENVLLEMIGSRPEDLEDANLYMSVWHALYSMNIINKYNVRFPSERKVMSEDLAFHIDYLRRSSSVSYIRDCLYFYRINLNSLSRVFDDNRFYRHKELFYIISQKLSGFLSKDQFILREQRKFLGAIRGQIMSIVSSNVDHKFRRIGDICKDDLVRETLFSYPYFLNPLKHKLFNFCVRNELVLALYVLAFLGSRKHRSII